jgi:integration host factor subunit beta
MDLGYCESKGEVMDKSHLIAALSRDTGFPTRKAEEVVKAVFNSMANALADGDRVEIRSFGSFKVKHHDGYTGKKPKTGKPIKVKPKRLPFSETLTGHCFVPIKGGKLTC